MNCKYIVNNFVCAYPFRHWFSCSWYNALNIFLSFDFVVSGLSMKFRMLEKLFASFIIIAIGDLGGRCWLTLNKFGWRVNLPCTMAFRICAAVFAWQSPWVSFSSIDMASMVRLSDSIIEFRARHLASYLM